MLVEELKKTILHGGSVFEDLGLTGIAILRGVIGVPHQWGAEKARILSKRCRDISQRWVPLRRFRCTYACACVCLMCCGVKVLWQVFTKTRQFVGAKSFVFSISTTVLMF
jgi:hypothetical protein